MRTNFLPYSFAFLLLLLGSSCKKDDANIPDPVLNISRTAIEVGNDVGYTDTLLVQSNIDWTISASDTWFSVDPVKRAAGDSTIVTIKVTAANTVASQTGTITIAPAGSNMPPRQISITRKAYSLVWQKCYGGSENDDFRAAALLSNGQFISTGYSISTDGDALGNPARPAGWAYKAGSDGNRIWQQKSGTIGTAYVSIAVAPDGSTASVGYGLDANQYTDIDAVKYDANGNLVWSKAYGGSFSESPGSIVNTADGGYIFSGDAGSDDGDVKFNRGWSDFWVVKTDANGGIVWSKTFGGDKNDYAATITACSDGGYVLLGMTDSHNSGDVGMNHSGIGAVDWLVVKIDANGNKLWSKTIGGSRDEISSAVIADGDGGCILLGYTNSKDGDVAGRSGTDVDTWVVKLNKDGEISWQTAFGGSGSDLGMAMVRLPNGNIAISGNSNSLDRGITGNHGLDDTWVVVLNNRGKVLWQKVYGSSAAEYNEAISAGNDGSILVTSVVTGNDGDVSGNHGKRDGWIFKLQ